MTTPPNLLSRARLPGRVQYRLHRRLTTGRWGGVWIDPNEDRINFFWNVKWPVDISWQLVSFANPVVTITDSDLELAALVLYEAVFSSISASPEWRKPTSEINRTPTVVWTFRKASTINPVLAVLLSSKYATTGSTSTPRPCSTTPDR